MKNNRIKIKIYGDGAQSKQIKELLNNNFKTEKKNNKVPITDVVEYFNFLPIYKLIKIYSESNCLMLQLADKKSLQYVIPSKIFEYAATNKPIIHGSKGYTKKFISYINGNFNYKKILICFSPVIPHFANECLENLKLNKEVRWPIFDKNILETDEVKYVIQINGKKRSIITAKNLEICKYQRKKFLDGFIIEKIMERYCKFIINNQI